MLDNTKFHVPVFQCKWLENHNGIRVDELGFTLVDLNKERHKENTFILASQVKQVFFITDLADKSSPLFSQRSQNIEVIVMVRII